MELKYRLAASDMDSTLLDDGCNITDENLAAIRAAEAAGMIFTISTGRRSVHLSVIWRFSISLRR